MFYNCYWLLKIALSQKYLFIHITLGIYYTTLYGYPLYEKDLNVFLVSVIHLSI